MSLLLLLRFLFPMLRAVVCGMDEANNPRSPSRRNRLFASYLTRNPGCSDFRKYRHEAIFGNMRVRSSSRYASFFLSFFYQLVMTNVHFFPFYDFLTNFYDTTGPLFSILGGIFRWAHRAFSSSSSSFWGTFDRVFFLSLFHFFFSTVNQIGRRIDNALISNKPCLCSSIFLKPMA